MKQNLLFNTKLLSLLVCMLLGSSSWSQQNNAQTGSGNNAPVTKKKPQITMLSTYLLFNGTCKQAMEFYQSCFGGELVQTSVGQSPMKNAFPESMHNKTVNARLISETVDISASDWLRPNETPVRGNMVCLYLRGGTPAQLKTLFTKLSDGADVTEPLTMQPFGLYGALNDKFGVRWMFHTDQKDQ